MYSYMLFESDNKLTNTIFYNYKMWENLSEEEHLRNCHQNDRASTIYDLLAATRKV